MTWNNAVPARLLERTTEAPRLHGAKGVNGTATGRDSATRKERRSERERNGWIKKGRQRQFVWEFSEVVSQYSDKTLLWDEHSGRKPYPSHRMLKQPKCAWSTQEIDEIVLIPITVPRIFSSHHFLRHSVKEKQTACETYSRSVVEQERLTSFATVPRFEIGIAMCDMETRNRKSFLCSNWRAESWSEERCRSVWRKNAC